MKAAQKNNESGFSLVELMISSVIVLGIIMGILTTLLWSTQGTYKNQRPRTEALNDATVALDMMSRLIRMAGNNPNNIANLQAINPGAISGDGEYRTLRIRGDWRGATMNSTPDGATDDPFENVLFSVSGNKLMKQEEGEGSASIFLDNVQDMTFKYYTSENVPILNPLASLDLIARVDINLVVRPVGNNKEKEKVTFTTSAYVRQR